MLAETLCTTVKRELLRRFLFQTAFGSGAEPGFPFVEDLEITPPVFAINRGRLVDVVLLEPEAEPEAEDDFSAALA